MTLDAYTLPHARPYIERAIRDHAHLPAWYALLQALQYDHVRGDLHELGANYYAALERELQQLAEGHEGVAHNGSTLAARRQAARAALDVARWVTDDELRTLRAEAERAGDTAQVLLCDEALWRTPAGSRLDLERERAGRVARAKCGAAIAEALAQEDRS